MLDYCQTVKLCFRDVKFMIMLILSIISLQECFCRNRLFDGL